MSDCTEAIEEELFTRASPSLPTTPYNYANPPLPGYLNAPPIVAQINIPPTNAITDHDATLGRVLFYDKGLSVNNSVSCASLFKNAFGSEQIDSARMVRAIAQFIRSMVSYTTKYDAGRANLKPQQNLAETNIPNLTASENLGKRLFFTTASCAPCHGSDTFTAPGAHNNGLDQVFADNGVGKATNNPALNGQFKVPSLRSIEKTAPYMHDGRFATLREVILHYNNGVKNHPNLSPPLRLPDGGVRRLNPTEEQITALVDFLKTLTDTQIETDVKFSYPFPTGR